MIVSNTHSPAPSRFADMQAPPSTSQRSIQRRSPAGDSGPPPNVPPRAMSPGPGPQSRPSNASSRSAPNGSSRRQNAGQTPPSSSNGPPLSQIEKSVTHLLVATKQLLETLTQWSRHQATDAQVSDVYVRLGYEFNIACRAFTSIGVDTTDLGNVPELLRHILESTLSQEASQESLEKYLPRIRDIIITLLHGLKRKQQKLRQKQPRDTNGDTNLPRISSVSSASSTNTGLTTLLDQGINSSFRGEGGSVGSDNRDSGGSNEGVPPRTSSSSTIGARNGGPPRDQSRASTSSDQSSLSSTTMQNIPVVPPYDAGDEVPNPRTGREVQAKFSVDSFPPPPPTPKQQNALAALQSGGDLERRASRRYSAYQISKHLNAPSVVPMIPPAQNSPIPNRGRNDARESMRAVQTRGPQQHTRQKSSRVVAETSPTRVPSRVLEEATSPPTVQPVEAPPNDNPNAKTSNDNLRQPEFDAPSATLKGPPSDPFPVLAESSPEREAQRPQTSPPPMQPASTYPQRFSPEPSPPSGNAELTLFLQYKTKVKKFIFVPEGNETISIARLQLAFIEKFSWNTHNNGAELPDIYIQDPVSGVRHELEDLTDVKDRSVLVLNVEVLDEVKRHFDEGMGGIKKLVEGVKLAMDDQQATIQRVSERQNETSKELAKLAAAPPQSSGNSIHDNRRTTDTPISPSQLTNSAGQSEIQAIKRDLAVMRQMYSNVVSEVGSGFAKVRAKADYVKSLAGKVVTPVIDASSGRYHVTKAKKKIDEESDKLVTIVDDLQDTVEDLRKDVVLRGVRPLPRQLEALAKDIAQATMELSKHKEVLKRENPIFKETWRKELEVVCSEQQEMSNQDLLITDLDDDLDKILKLFALVEQATKEQMKDAPGAPGVRLPSRGLNHITPAADPSAAKEGVLDEVRALQPNHENRLEAIERAEKLRQKELESRRGGEFQKELGTFVEEGRLKKSGGFEEVERARKAKDDRIRKEVWERQNGMTQADAMAAEEEAEQVEVSTFEDDTDVEEGIKTPPADI